MKKLTTAALAALFMLPLGWVSAQALSFDQDVTTNVIYGSGNANGGFTVDQSNGIELGLRTHQREPVPMNVYNSNGDGTYSWGLGSATQALWNYDWSINTDYLATSGNKVGDFTYKLGLDFDPAYGVYGTNFFTFDPIHDYVGVPDHSFGDNSTAMDGGFETNDGLGSDDAAEYASFLSTYNIAQQSWRPIWHFPGFDTDIDGTYNIYLEAYDGANLQARTDITVIVGDGGLRGVPEPGSAAALGLGLVALGLAARRKRIAK
jgi:hypothetical protein